MDDRPKDRRTVGWPFVPLFLIVAAGTWLALDPGFRWKGPSSDAAADLSQDAFGQRVRAYLLEHPEVVMEAVRRFEARQQEREESEAQKILKVRAEDILRDPNSPVGGNPQGDVSLVEFFDYNCPYCRRVAPVMVDAEAADPQLRIVYKEFPILGPNSTFAAKAALAVHRQGKYVAFHQALMQARGTVNEARVLDVAAKIGVDIERMKSDMNDPAIQAAIDKNLELARALRINGTPGFVLGQQILRGATDLKTLQSLIREARESQ
jgi:protein-disulfide isomerase